jgi:hypothetical protein
MGGLHQLAVEGQFDHFTGGRFRHGTKFLRWRPEKVAAGLHHPSG